MLLTRLNKKLAQKFYFKRFINLLDYIPRRLRVLIMKFIKFYYKIKRNINRVKLLRFQRKINKRTLKFKTKKFRKIIKKVKSFIKKTLYEFLNVRNKKKYYDFKTTPLEIGALKLYGYITKQISKKEYGARFFKKFKKYRRFLKKNYFLGKIVLKGSKNNFFYTYMENDIPKKYITVWSNYETRTKKGYDPSVRNKRQWSWRE
jgi:hypothetical protein